MLRQFSNGFFLEYYQTIILGFKDFINLATFGFLHMLYKKRKQKMEGYR